MKNIILFFIVGLLILSCRKEEPTNDTDALKQYIEFSINDTTIKYVESDSISFSPHWSFEYKDSDSNYVFHIGSKIQMKRNQGYNRSFILFYSKIPGSQTYITPYAIPAKLLKPGVFESLFTPGQVEYLKQNCFDSISNNLSIGMVFPSFEKYQTNYLTHFHGCDNNGNPSFYNQDNCTFNIEKIQNYYHEREGECLLLTGDFRANLYPDPVPADSSFIQIENGKFKILISEPDNIYYYNNE